MCSTPKSHSTSRQSIRRTPTFSADAMARYAATANAADERKRQRHAESAQKQVDTFAQEEEDITQPIENQSKQRLMTGLRAWLMYASFGHSHRGVH